jgi:predicted DNA-binding protein
MPVVKRRPKAEKARYTFLLPEELKETLEAYSKYMNVPEAEIVAAAIDHAIKTDKEFAHETTTASRQETAGAPRPKNTREKAATN